MKNSPIIIVGFHRSGTSLLAQLLYRSGLFLGDDLLGSMPSNPYGHFEDAEVVRLHEDILRAHGDTWQVDGPRAYHVSGKNWKRMQGHVQKRMAEHRVWGFKDPRVCFFLGAWKYIIPNAKFVVTYRDPAESVYSLERRQSTDLFLQKGKASIHQQFWRNADLGMRMWTAHNQAVLDFVNSHGRDCLILPFSHLSRGFPVMAEINRKFGTNLQEVPTTAVFDVGVTQPRPGPQWVFSSAVADAASKVWDRLDLLAAPYRSEGSV